ncbi:MAG: helix-turn-helix domain-containing protein [Kiritimatiellaeota bacterium]|nr:helix-turn-helix domain-containing protein [Kiritimatiellota bacterium]
MKKKEMAFAVEDLMGALDETIAYAKGKKTLHATLLPSPPKAEMPQPSRITRIRRQLNVSQSVFAMMFNVSPMTAKSWENGRRLPSGPARRLLEIAESNPGLFVPEKLLAVNEKAFDLGRAAVEK